MAFIKPYKTLHNKAKEDFVAALYLLDGFNNHGLELKLEIIFFHFQQCAEKLVKSILDYHGIKYPHIHDIEKLINLLEENKIYIEVNTETLIKLTEYAVDGRYDIIHDDMEDTSKYIDVLKKFFLHVEKIITKKED